MFTGAVADYIKPLTVYVSARRNVYITTRTDNTVEYNETFAVSIPPDLIHNSPAAADCITTVNVLIINDDCKLHRNVCPFHGSFYKELYTYYMAFDIETLNAIYTYMLLSSKYITC